MCNMCRQQALYGTEITGDDEGAGTVGLTIRSGFDVGALADLVFGPAAEPEPARRESPQPVPAPPPPREQINLREELRAMGYDVGQ